MNHSNKFNKTVGLPAVIYRVLKRIAFQRKFLLENISPIIHKALEKNDGSVGSSDLKKINDYYGLAVPALLGEAFCVLRGKEMSLLERWASTCQGAMTGLFDDFFDKDYMADEAIEKMIAEENSTSAKRSNQLLFDIFYKNALEHVPDRKLMKQKLLDVYKAQTESRVQEKDSLPPGVLQNITFQKGGSSLIFYRTAFSPAATGEEIKLLYGLGGIMQLSNDIFDVYKDRESGIRTLVTETSSINDIRKVFKGHLNQYYNDAFKIGKDVKDVREFLDILSVGIFSRCFVCLDQLEGNERSTGNKFAVHEYSREQLICDMDKKMNMLRSARSYISDIP